MLHTLAYAYRKLQKRLIAFRHPLLRRSLAIDSHLTATERVRLFELASGARIVAELGSYLGASACAFSAGLQASGGGQVICIDTWMNDAMSEGGRDTWSQFLRNTSTYKDLIIPIRGLSTEVVGKVKSLTKDLDLLFIDGDHSYKSVKADWDEYKVFLKPGSIVVFHDTGWAEGVKRVVREDVIPYVGAHDQLPNMWWGTIGRVA